MANQLSKFYLRRSYQLISRLGSDDLPVDKAFATSCDLIYGWARFRFQRVFPNIPYYPETYDAKSNGYDFGVLHHPDEGLFVLRVSHPDESIPGRIWIVDAFLQKEEEDCIFAVRVSVSTPQGCTEDVPFSRPGFVRKLIQDIGVSDYYYLDPEPMLLDTEEEVYDFIRFLESPERHLPVLLITPCFDPEDALFEDEMVDALQMAKNLEGFSHVFRITQDANDLLTELLGPRWSAYNGAIRTYYPGFSIAEENYYQHPRLTPQGIRIRNIDDSGEHCSCMQDVETYIKNFGAKRRILWENHNIEFYLSAYQKEILAQRNLNAQTQDDEIELLNLLLEEMQEQCDEHKQMENAYADECERYQQENDELRKHVGQLKLQIAALRRRLESSTGVTSADDVPEDGSYAQIPEWIDQYYSDRLMLHSRAARSLKHALYADTGLVYRCLKLLATKYYDYRMGSITYDDFYRACKKVDSGLDERAAITDVAAGMQGDTYFVHHGGKKRKLERHLTKGNNKDQRRCLRIYFFWDQESQMIVIGDLPHHLDTTAT